MNSSSAAASATNNIWTKILKSPSSATTISSSTSTIGVAAAAATAYNYSKFNIFNSSSSSISNGMITPTILKTTPASTGASITAGAGTGAASLPINNNKTMHNNHPVVQPPPITISIGSMTAGIIPASLGGSGGSASGGSTTATVITPGTAGKSLTNHEIPSDILDDLASRFIINVPDDERKNLIRICFQIELAHWFYLDFFCSIEEKKLVPCGIKQFATHLFQHIPFLRIHLASVDKILEDFRRYKLSVPTYGAILLSEDLKHVLLVQSYLAKSSWGFPKGKVNEHEDPIHCATREVFEETGYDITDLIVPTDYIEAIINYQYTRLYLVTNVPLQTLFSPRTRKEIKCCEWFPVDSLPTNKNDITSKANLGINANSFFMIMPFIKRLKKWVSDNRLGGGSSINIRNKNEAGGGGDASNTINGSKIFNSNYNGHNNNHNINLNGSSVINNNSNNSCNGNINVNNSNNCLNKYGHSSSKNCSNSNNCNNNNRRQRHKSMGDIDGIKINVTNHDNGGSNNINNITTKTAGKRTIINGGEMNNSTTLSSLTSAGGTGGQMGSIIMPGTVSNGNKNEKLIIEKREKQHPRTNSRRQLFFTNGNNINGSTTSNACNQQNSNGGNILNGSNGNLGDKDKGSSGGPVGSSSSGKSNIIIITNRTNNNSNILNNRNANRNNSNNINNNNQQQQQHQNLVKSTNLLISQQSPLSGGGHRGIIPMQNKMRSLNVNGSNNGKSDHKKLISEIQKHHHHQKQKQQLVSKFNLNLDPWTSFTFTKNFIANVFC